MAHFCECFPVLQHFVFRVRRDFKLIAQSHASANYRRAGVIMSECAVRREYILGIFAIITRARSDNRGVCVYVWGYNERVRERERDALNFTSLTRKKAGERAHIHSHTRAEGAFLYLMLQGETAINRKCILAAALFRAAPQKRHCERAENKALCCGCAHKLICGAACEQLSRRSDMTPFE